MAKSQLFIAGVTDSDTHEILQHTDLSLGSFPVRYLGTPLVYGKVKTCHFKPLIERIAGFLNAWSSHSLTYAGKLELISSVIQGVESFWIQNVPIPSTIIEQINRICRKFIWAGNKPKVAWADICIPKDEGGLGLRNCKTWNKAMLIKTL